MKKKENDKRRPKGAGSIRKNPNGTYVGRISVSGHEQFSCTGYSEKDVERKLAEYRKRILKEDVIPKRIFVGNYIEKWLEVVKKPTLKAASYDRLESTYTKHIKGTTIARCQLGNVTSMDAQRLINEKALTLSYSSVKKIYGLLNACFKYAVVSRDLDYNPMSAVVLPREENMPRKTRKMQVFTEAELDRIEHTAEIKYSSGEIRYKHAYLFVLMANTGLRAGEAIALTWDNVDFKNRLIHVCQSASSVRNRSDQSQPKYRTIITTVKTKNGNRTIPCNDKAMQALYWLKRYQEEHHIVSPFVDCNSEGEILKQSTLPKILKAILAAAGVPYKNVHAFRHTFATNLIQAGVDVKVVSQLLGHASVRITYDIYVHTDLENAVAAVNQLNAGK